ncbi:MAG: chemotaxis protein CheW [Vicinamibacteria bacterium]|nr:chemotaxis protein CheW [Vicinamibacteria bacterium]
MTPPVDSKSAILARRAGRTARVRQDTATQEVVEIVLCVGVNDAQIGIPREAVAQIVPLQPTTRIPGAPGAVVGIIQLKGEIIAVVDTALCLGFRGGGQSRLIVIVDGKPGKLGLLVDVLYGLREIKMQDVAMTMLDAAIGTSNLVRSTTKGLMSILDMEQLFNSEMIRAVHEATMNRLVAQGESK